MREEEHGNDHEQLWLELLDNEREGQLWQDQPDRPSVCSGGVGTGYSFPLDRVNTSKSDSPSSLVVQWDGVAPRAETGHAQGWS